MVRSTPIYLSEGRYDWEFRVGVEHGSMGTKALRKDLHLVDGTYDWRCYLTPGDGTYTGKCVLQRDVGGPAVLQSKSFHIPADGRWTWGGLLNRTGS
ncbi:hypothetical protein [Streptomyces blastmyceticus]|uniref:hypothetical protein n=1 Tax=Streptomyces blastmyceticus TaxID=68180 RepID=UPI0031D55783